MVYDVLETFKDKCQSFKGHRHSMKMLSDRQIIAFKKSGSLNLMAMSWKPVDSSLCVCTA